MPQGHIKLGSIDAVNLKTQGIDTPAIGNNQVTEGKLTPELRAQIAARTLPTNTIRLGEQLVRNGTFDLMENGEPNFGKFWNEANVSGATPSYAGGVATIRPDTDAFGNSLSSLFIQNNLPIISFPKDENPAGEPELIGTAMGIVLLLRFELITVQPTPEFEALGDVQNDFLGINAILGFDSSKSTEYSATSPFLRHGQTAFESLMVMGYPLTPGGEGTVGFRYSLSFRGAPNTVYSIANVTLHRLKTGRT